MLNMISHGQPTDQPGLLIAHGLYGSARNWGVIARRLSQDREVIAVDMRNHGASRWFDSHRYHDLAEDLAGVLARLDRPFDILGHSMGGKAAMVLAMTRPELVQRLIVADIAPVAYGHSQIQYIEAMRAVDLQQVQTRADADAQLARHVQSKSLRSFFLQSLDIKDGAWRLNLDVLGAFMPKILGFPRMEAAFHGPTLFLSGAASDYVTRAHRPEIKRLFPEAGFLKIPDAGHWLHAEKPREFEAAVSAWLAHHAPSA